MPICPSHHAAASFHHLESVVIICNNTCRWKYHMYKSAFRFKYRVDMQAVCTFMNIKSLRWALSCIAWLLAPCPLVSLWHHCAPYIAALNTFWSVACQLPVSLNTTDSMSLRGGAGGRTVERIFLAYSELCSPALRSACSTFNLLSAAICGSNSSGWQAVRIHASTNIQHKEPTSATSCRSYNIRVHCGTL